MILGTRYEGRRKDTRSGLPGIKIRKLRLLAAEQRKSMGNLMEVFIWREVFEKNREILFPGKQSQI